MKHVEHTSPTKPITENQTKVEANHLLAKNNVVSHSNILANILL